MTACYLLWIDFVNDGFVIQQPDARRLVDD
jgi:hypothetical protein